jgi:hypothetical protein
LRSVVKALDAGVAHSSIISGGSVSGCSAAAAAGSVRRSASADGSSSGSSCIAVTLADKWLAVLNKLLHRAFTTPPLRQVMPVLLRVRCSKYYASPAAACTTLAVVVLARCHLCVTTCLQHYCFKLLCACDDNVMTC